jgi:sterol desaturase/sphingolipid hydroxylase (fatty acid hydroxylase superfamily)
MNYFQSTTYWIAFVGAFLAVAVWESFQPKRPLSGPAERRWGSHAVLLLVSTLLVKVVLRVSPVVVATAVAGSRWGILNRPWLPFAVRCAATLLLLDLTNYLVHRTYHAVGFLWRVHEVHHSDPDYDVSTAGRFHPLEVLIGQTGLLSVIALSAPPPAAVFAAELLTLLINFFVHANVSLPVPVERVLRTVIITPGLHRIHHSEEMEEQGTNLGQTFSWWDRLFGTYLDEPDSGEDRLVTGVKGLQTPASAGLGFMLSEPFRSRAQSQADPIV